MVKTIERKPPSSSNLEHGIVEEEDATGKQKNSPPRLIKIFVLIILCCQNSGFTLLRRYSLGVLEEEYSKYELLLSAEIFKMIFSAYMIWTENPDIFGRLCYVFSRLWKMLFLAVLYGVMNTLSLMALKHIGAGVFTILAQCKILSTAGFSTLILGRKYTSTKWRALISLVIGVLLFSHTVWNKESAYTVDNEDANAMFGVILVLCEVTLSGFASIYFEKVIKVDPEKLTIWENNFNLALGSVPIYLAFIMYEGGGKTGFGGGWSHVTVLLSLLAAGGGLLVALSIKYGDSILKTLATSGGIVLSSVLDKIFLGGPLTPVMGLAGVQVIVSIFNYTFDATPKE